MPFARPFETFVIRTHGLARSPFPAKRRGPFDARLSRSTPPCFVRIGAPQGICEVVDRAWVNTQRDIPRDLGQRRSIRRDNRRPARHRFQHGQTETFVKRGKHEQLGAIVPEGQFLNRHVTDKSYSIGEVQAADSLEHVTGEPPSAAPNNQRWTATGIELCIRRQQPHKILARLDRPDKQPEAIRQIVRRTKRIDVGSWQRSKPFGIMRAESDVDLVAGDAEHIHEIVRRALRNGDDTPRAAA